MSHDKIFIHPRDQADFERVAQSMTARQLDLARLLFSIEREGTHDAYGIGHRIAPIYIMLAHNLLAKPENKAALLKLLME